MCEEYESLHDRSGQPDKVMGQSIVLSEIKTEVPLENDDPAYQNLLLQRYEEQGNLLMMLRNIINLKNKITVMENIDSVPSNVQSSREEALLYVFEDNEAVIKMIIKGRSPTLRHVSRTHRVALDWLFDRVNLDPKIQIKHIDTNNQLADIFTEGNFTRDEWNHLLCLNNISHFSSAVCFAVMAKRSQKDSGEERVTAKSRPMMNLIARTPSFVSSSTSVGPGKKHYGNQDPWKSIAGEDRSGHPGKETGLFEASDH